MFEHRRYPVTIPQYEHGKLAGHLASHWGNDDFDRPPGDPAPWIAGVTFHDWGYGLIDNVLVPGAPEPNWLAVMRQGVAFRFEHPLTDILVKLHIRRLLSWHPTPEREKLMAEIDQLVAQRLPETGLSLAQCRWIDGITRFCDFVAFDFCLGKTGAREVEAPSRWDTGAFQTITYVIQADDIVKIHPWPFDVPSFDGLLVAYQREGYPEVRQPRLLSYQIFPGLHKTQPI